MVRGLTLQHKFAVLLGFLGATITIALAATLSYALLMQREIVNPFADAATVREHLDVVRQELVIQQDLLERGDRAGGAPPELAPSVERVAGHLETMATDVTLRIRAGTATTRNLIDRISAAEASAAAWFEGGDPAVRERAQRQLDEVIDLIAMIDIHVLRGAQDTFRDDGMLETLRHMQLRLLAAGVVAAILCGLLGTMLFRRWVVRPVADLRRAAEQISQGNFEHRVPVRTSDELGQLGAEVNEMAATIRTMQARAIERERLAATGEMVQRITHNLRGPLAGIRSLAELTRMRLEPDAPVHADQDEIIQTVDRFNLWLRELLQATTPARVTPRETEVAPWLAEIAATHAPMARTRAIALRVDADAAPPRATFDPQQLEHALTAVVTNAIQASPESGTVRVDAAANGATWSICVSDEGPGIEPDLLETIFRPYFTTKPDGNGIGLAVVQQVVTAHDGRIEVDTAPGRGCRFSITLPR